MLVTPEENQSKNKPLLSVCIPTYNRAERLAEALNCIAPQIEEIAADGEVELVISDNASPDATPDVVRAAQAKYPGVIRYSRNDSNIGFTGNLSRLCDELACGEYCWLIGDDDLVVEGGIIRVLKILCENPQTDFAFVNTASLPPFRRNEIIKSNTYANGACRIDLTTIETTPKAKDLTNYRVARFDDLIDPRVDDVFMGAMMCAIFRTALWRNYKLPPIAYSAAFTSVECSYPHTVTFARTMVGRPAYYIGEPCTLNFFGEQEWSGFLPLLITVHLQDVLDIYAEMGVSRRQVERCRRALLSYSGQPIDRMLTKRETPGRAQFSLAKFLWRNRRHPDLLAKSMLIAARSRLSAG